MGGRGGASGLSAVDIPKINNPAGQPHPQILKISLLQRTI